MSEFLKPEVEEADREFFAGLNTPAAAGNWPAYQAKQQSAMVALMKGGDVERDYDTTLNNLTQGGSDPEIDGYRADGERDLESIDEEVAKGIITAEHTSPADKILEINALVQAGEGIAPPPLKGVYLNQQAIDAHTTQPREDRTQLKLMDSLEDVLKANTTIEKMMQERGAQFDSSTGKAFADFAATALPGFGFKMKAIIDTVVPEEGAAFQNILPGEAMVEFRRVMSEATPAERVEMAKGVLQASQDVSGLVWENNFEEHTYLMDLLSDLNPSDSEVQFDRWLNNLFGILDVVPFGTAVVRGGRTILKNVKRGGALAATSESAPRNAAQVMKAALDDKTDHMVDAAGTTREEIVTSHSFPNPDLDDVEVKVGPDINAILAQPAGSDKGLRTHGINYTETEKAAAKDRTTQRLEEVALLDNVEQLSKTIATPIDGGINARNVIGATDSYGWSSTDELRDAVEDYLEVTEGASVTVLKRDYADGNFKPATEAQMSEPGEFLAQLDINHLYNPADVTGEAFDKAVIGVSGSAAKYVNKTSTFERWITDAGNVAADQSSYIKADLVRTMKPYNQLNGKEQANVMQALDDGDSFVDPISNVHTGKWFTREELALRFDGNERQIRGYESVRKHQEKIYEMQNERMRTRLLGDGFQQVHNPESGYTGLGRKVERHDLEQGDLTAFNASSGTMDEIDVDALDDLYANDGYLARMPQDEAIGEDLSDLIVIRPGDKTHLLKLPTYVLKKRDGYVTKIYDTTHIVKKKVSGVKKNGQLIKPDPSATFNGRPLAVGERLLAVKMAGNPAAANRAARQLQRDAADGEEYGVVRAKEITDIEYGNQNNYEFFKDKGQLFFSKRGSEVESVTGERTLKSIAESLDAARNNVSKHVGMDDLLDGLTKRWEKRYGKAWGEGPEGRFPVRDFKAKTADATQDVERADALALRDHINMLAGTDQTAMRRITTQLNIAAAEKIAGLGERRLLGLNEKLSEVILKHRDKNLLDLAKSLAFIKFIVLNPSRQLLLQSQQATVMLGLEHGFKYFASGKGVLDYTGLTAGLAALDNPKVWRVLAPHAAKGMGMTTKEYKNFVEAFRKTGLPNSMDSHDFAQALSLDPRTKVGDNLVGRAAGTLRNATDSTLRFTRRIGFDAGEYNNLAASWLAVRNKWIKNNPGKNWLDTSAQEEIGAQARAVSFNMNAAGTLQQQKGAMGLMFQFMSHTTKAIQVLIPDTKLTRNLKIGKLSDKTFSNKEKFRIALWQAGLYGTGGLGANAIYQKMRDEAGIEVPVHISRNIEEGLAGMAVNAVFQANDTGDEETSLAFSSSFAPFSGTPQATPLHKIIPAMFDAVMLQPVDQRMISPPGFSAVKQIAETFEVVDFILRGVDLPEDAPNKWLTAADRALSVSSGYDNFLQGRIANEIGQFVTRNGNPTVQATAGEILARQMFGIRPRAEEQLRDELKEVRGISATVEEGGNRRIDGYARDYAAKVMTVFRQVGVQGNTIPQEAYRALEPHITAMQLGLNEAEFFHFGQRLQEHLFRDLTQNNETRLGKEISRLLGQGLEVGGEMTTRIGNMENFEGKEELVNLFNVLEGKSSANNQEKE